jgi:hypothetical protein
MTSLNLAFLGVGAIAREHAAAALSLGHRVVAGSSSHHDSPRWRAFQEIAPEARLVSNGQSLLDDDSIDAFVVCLSWFAIPEWIGRLLRHPKPMLIEKPIHLFSTALEVAVRNAGATQANKMVAMNRRFFEPVRVLRRRVAQGGLKGAEIAISENVGRLIERYGLEIGPHILPYSSCHILDVAQYVLGALRVIEIRGYDDPGYPVPFRSFNGLLAAGEVPVGFALNADDPIPVGLRLRFDDHTHWHLSPIEVLSVFDSYDVIEPTADYNVRRYTPVSRQCVLADTYMRPGIHEQMRAFGEGRFDEGASVADFVATLRLIENIRSAGA